MCEPLDDEEIIEVGQDGTFDIATDSMSKSPGKAEEWRLRGNDAFKEGDFDWAIECYTKGLTEFDGLVGVSMVHAAPMYSNRALCYHKKHAAAVAAAAAQKEELDQNSSTDAASAVLHDDPAVAADVAVLLLVQMLKDCELAIASDADFAKGHFRRSQALHGMGQRKEALQVAQEAKKKGPNDKAIVDWLKKLQADEVQRDAEAIGAEAVRRVLDEAGDAPISAAGVGVAAATAAAHVQAPDRVILSVGCLEAAKAAMYLPCPEGSIFEDGKQAEDDDDDDEEDAAKAAAASGGGAGEGTADAENDADAEADGGAGKGGAGKGGAGGAGAGAGNGQVDHASSARHEVAMRAATEVVSQTGQLYRVPPREVGAIVGGCLKQVGCSITQQATGAGVAASSIVMAKGGTAQEATAEALAAAQATGADEKLQAKVVYGVGKSIGATFQFEPAQEFEGLKAGYVFMKGYAGQGYYKDTGHMLRATLSPAQQRAQANGAASGKGGAGQFDENKGGLSDEDYQMLIEDMPADQITSTHRDMMESILGMSKAEIKGQFEGDQLEQILQFRTFQMQRLEIARKKRERVRQGLPAEEEAPPAKKEKDAPEAPDAWLKKFTWGPVSAMDYETAVGGGVKDREGYERKAAMEERARQTEREEQRQARRAAAAATLFSFETDPGDETERQRQARGAVGKVCSSSDGGAAADAGAKPKAKPAAAAAAVMGAAAPTEAGAAAGLVSAGQGTEKLIDLLKSTSEKKAKARKAQETKCGIKGAKGKSKTSKSHDSGSRDSAKAQMRALKKNLGI
jgi:tetratricopeptide (TPR) repeat protein